MGRPLRGKFVIDNFAIKGISWQSRANHRKSSSSRTRKTADQALPPLPKLAGAAKSAALEEAQRI